MGDGSTYHVIDHVVEFVVYSLARKECDVKVAGDSVELNN